MVAALEKRCFLEQNFARRVCTFERHGHFGWVEKRDFGRFGKRIWFVLIKY
jgi:hypothetical protein